MVAIPCCPYPCCGGCLPHQLCVCLGTPLAIPLHCRYDSPIGRFRTCMAYFPGRVCIRNSSIQMVLPLTLPLELKP